MIIKRYCNTRRETRCVRDMQAMCLTTTTFGRYTGGAARGKGRREKTEGERARGKFTSSSLVFG